MGPEGAAPEAGSQAGAGQNQQQQPPQGGFRGTGDGVSLARPVEQQQPPADRPRNPVPASRLGDEGLAARIRRSEEAARRKVLDELGIQDPDAYRKSRETERTELARLKKAEEDAKRAQMTEVERFRADLEAAQQSVAERDARIAELEEQIDVGRVDTVARAAAAESIDPEFVDYALGDLRLYLRTKTEAEVADFDEADMRRFFRRLAADKPRLAKTTEPEAPTNPPRSVAASAPRRPAQQPPQKRTVAPPGAVRRPAGAPAPKPAPPPAKPDRPGEFNGKTVRPGQANSMSKSELKAELARQGLKGW